MIPIDRHRREGAEHRAAWGGKPRLEPIYRSFYERLLPWFNPLCPGPRVEIGSGSGRYKAFDPGVMATDLFPHPWIDLACDAYHLPFRPGTIAHLVLIDVFHHLEHPRAFLQEAWRVLKAGGRVLLLEPYVSWTSFPVYAWLHPEPVGWGCPIPQSEFPPPEPRYYAAQGNATRFFFRGEGTWTGWRVRCREAFSCWEYLLSGGFSRPAVYPAACAPLLRRADRLLSRFPRLFGGRCLVALEKGSD